MSASKILAECDAPADDATEPTTRLEPRLLAIGDKAVGIHAQGWATSLAAPAPDGGLSHEIEIVFGIGGNAHLVTRGGWSVPEPGYLWSAAGESILVLPRPRVSSDHELLIQLAPFTHGTALRSQRLEMEINGLAVAGIEIAEQVVISIQLPWPVLSRHEAVRIRFITPDAARPIDVSGVPDHRDLAFSFRRLRLAPLSPGLEPHTIDARETIDMPIAELMLRFESLGENCEFGLVQRRCGAEPLGLLRFASAPLPRLLAALHARFAGLGVSENVAVQVSENGQEFMVQDHAFGFHYHAWVKLGEKSPEEIHLREVRRVPFLIRKLVEELTAGEKVFVYHGMQPLSPTEARALEAAVASYGPGTVLWVELADVGHPPGSLERWGPQLVKAYIDRFAPGEDAHDFSAESWIAICRAALTALPASRTARIT